ncbi:MAG: adenosine deaminase, partial [Azospirillaceae bacterium]
MRISPFIGGLPKVELHMHIEGSLEPAMMLALARRNGVDLPYATEQEVAAAYDFGELQDFLNLYYQGMSVLRTEADFRDLTAAYLTRVAAENVRHVEIFFDPQGHTGRGIAFDTVLDGIHGALVDGERRHGITFR